MYPSLRPQIATPMTVAPTLSRSTPALSNPTSPWTWLIAALLFVSLTGCSPLKFLNVLSPSRHYERIPNLTYGDAPRQQLDVYLPSSAPERAPLVIFFYGGGWIHGTKENYEFVAASLTEAGNIVVIPDYRLFPEVRFPTFVDDGALAVAWSLENIEAYGVSHSSVYVMGHSAGAYIAAMLATNGQYLAAYNVGNGSLDGFIGLSGPYDFLPIQGGYLEEVFPAASRTASQPINFVSSTAPPTLLIHGTGDRTVNVVNSKSLADALRGSAVDVTLKTYEGVGHARVVLGLARPLAFSLSTLEDCRAFISATMTQP